MKRNRVSGLHIWSVGLLNSCDNLWITTKTNSIFEAARKANRVLIVGYAQNVRINSIVKHGTLDA